MATEPTSATSGEVTPEAVVDFWKDAGWEKWFAKDDAFDARFRERFLGAHEAAGRGELDAWAERPEGSLALVILLDQLPRNAFRDSPRMYATDARGLAVADRAVRAGHVARVPADLRVFFYLPFEHSEDLADQERSLALHASVDPSFMKYAAEHHDIIRRFGRFPHRNAILGRESTPEELAFLAAGGFGG